MAEQSLPTGAVFLSHASQDAEAAARICGALRAAGVEVWFDGSELRGGDAWDSQIKKQIHDCALFVPVISAHTDARSEGYFRGEWHLATRRLHNMADDAAFLIPVVVDETREADARVPEEFFRAQWTWLPGGETPPAFAHRVRQLLGLDPVLVPNAKTAATGTIEPSARSVGSVRPSGTSLVRRSAIPLTALLLALSAAAFWYFQSVGDAPAAKSPTAVGAAAPNDKSIAVLPFADMSAGKDQEYFADGLSEELLNLLAKLPELRVIGRTSSFQFKGRNEDLRVIGEKLNVAHILEGSVRKSGEKLRITAQLIRATDGSRLWSESYDRTLDDIFAVQDEISAAVVAELEATLLGDGHRAQRVDAAAYDLFLRGRELARLHTAAAYEQAVLRLNQTLEIDPTYAPALTVLAYCYRRQANNGMLPMHEGYRLAGEALRRALASDADFAPAHAEQGRIALDYDVDAASAARHFERAFALDPVHPDVLSYSAIMAASLGRHELAGELNRSALKRDPLNPKLRNSYAFALRLSGRLDDALAEFRRVIELSPDALGSHYRVAEVLLLKRETAAALAEIERETSRGWRLAGLAFVHHSLRNTKQSGDALAALIEDYSEYWPYHIAAAKAWRGDINGAFEYLERAHRARDASLSDIAVDQLFAGIRNDARWLPLMRKLGLAPEQLERIRFDVRAPDAD